MGYLTSSLPPSLNGSLHVGLDLCGQFKIYRSVTSEEQYQPDFVAEFAHATYLSDIIQTGAVSDLTRQAALREWCRQASVVQGKPWRYTQLTTFNLSDELRQLI